MKETSIVITFLVFVLILSSFQMIAGHKPLKTHGSNNSDFTGAQEIPNHRVSWAIYEVLRGKDDAHYYKFTASEGERFYAQISIPKLQKFSTFAPSIALVGTNLTSRSLEGGYSLKEYTYDRGDLPISVPTGMTAIVMDYNLSTPSSEFYEPFTQTSYWERQEMIINSLPSESTYYLVVFDKRLMENTGKYTLAVGEIEDFSLVDFFTVIPSAWFDTKLFFEDYVTPIIAISLLIAVPVTIVTVLIMRVKKRDQPKTLDLE